MPVCTRSKADTTCDFTHHIANNHLFRHYHHHSHRLHQVRTVIAADFDNDGYQELFYNNIPGSNRLFSRAKHSHRRLHGDEEHGEVWEQV